MDKEILIRNVRGVNSSLTREYLQSLTIEQLMKFCNAADRENLCRQFGIPFTDDFKQKYVTIKEEARRKREIKRDYNK